MSNFKIKDLDPSSTPYEKFKKVGPSNLSDSELLAIIIRSGTKELNAIDIAENLISNFGYEFLLNCSYEELKKIKGIGEVKAIELKTIFELVNRIQMFEKKEKLSFESPDEIAAYSRCSFKLKNYELLKVFYLNARLELFMEEEYSNHDVNVRLPIKQIVTKAILNNVSRIVIAHNHPSGSLMPSDDDIKSTKKLLDALKNVDVKLEDNIIVTDNDYFSMRYNRYFDLD
ncbi:MAG: DNA repair protein RadC [Clostridia bacterium]|nr:DNA repair protein RadC [Clostridia bacterium]